MAIEIHTDNAGNYICKECEVFQGVDYVTTNEPQMEEHILVDHKVETVYGG